MSLVALGLVFAGEALPLLATDIMLLRKEARQARSEQVSTMKDRGAADAWFDEKYGKRLKQIDLWFEARFDPESASHRFSSFSSLWTQPRLAARPIAVTPKANPATCAMYATADCPAATRPQTSNATYARISQKAENVTVPGVNRRK